MFMHIKKYKNRNENSWEGKEWSLKATNTKEEKKGQWKHR